MEANGFQRSAVYVTLNAAYKLQLTLHLVNKTTNLGHMKVVFIDNDSLWTIRMKAVLSRRQNTI